MKKVNIGDLNLKWDLFLFSDGSMTKQLEVISKSVIKTDLLAEINHLNLMMHNQQFFDENIAPPLIQRQVVLQTSCQEPLMFAVSVWNQEQYEDTMKNKSIAIGSNLTQQKQEYFREIISVNIVNIQLLKQTYPAVKQIQDIQDNTEIKCRNYIMYKNKQILTYIEEYFLQKTNELLE